MLIKNGFEKLPEQMKAALRQYKIIGMSIKKIYNRCRLSDLKLKAAIIVNRIKILTLHDISTKRHLKRSQIILKESIRKWRI